nr:DUF4158 domain-containing protein [Edwardsiella piscicida]
MPRPLNPVRHRARKPAALPDAKDELIRHYTFNGNRPVGDPSASRRRESIGLRCAALLLAIPGTFLASMSLRFRPCCAWWPRNSRCQWKVGSEYGQREQTRREHLVELQTVFGFKPFTMSHYRQAVHTLTELALQTDKGIVLASALVENLRRQSIILPAMNAIERASAEAITPCQPTHLRALTDSLLSPPPSAPGRTSQAQGRQ